MKHYNLKCQVMMTNSELIELVAKTQRLLEKQKIKASGRRQYRKQRKTKKKRKFGLHFVFLILVTRRC